MLIKQCGHTGKATCENRQSAVASPCLAWPRLALPSPASPIHMVLPPKCTRCQMHPAVNSPYRAAPCRAWPRIAAPRQSRPSGVATGKPTVANGQSAVNSPCLALPRLTIPSPTQPGHKNQFKLSCLRAMLSKAPALACASALALRWASSSDSSRM